ncbi:MAG: M14 family zinc carboxypeptidase [Bacteroidales bacterium]
MALTINNPKTGAPFSKPGVYVDGNIHGNEIQAGEVCLYLANRLLTNYGKISEITEVVDRNVFYIIQWSMSTAGPISLPMQIPQAATGD